MDDIITIFDMNPRWYTKAEGAELITHEEVARRAKEKEIEAKLKVFGSNPKLKHGIVINLMKKDKWNKRDTQFLQGLAKALFGDNVKCEFYQTQTPSGYAREWKLREN